MDGNNRERAALEAIRAFLGNVDHSRGGGENSAKLYGGMLEDIRAIVNEALAHKESERA